MNVTVKGKSLELTEALEGYARKRLAKVVRLLDDGPTHVEVEFSEGRNRRVSECHTVEITVWAAGPSMRACASSDDMYAAIDAAAGKLCRQVVKAREKRLQVLQHGGAHGNDGGRFRSVPSGLVSEHLPHADPAVLAWNGTEVPQLRAS